MSWVHGNPCRRWPDGCSARATRITVWTRRPAQAAGEDAAGHRREGGLLPRRNSAGATPSFARCPTTGPYSYDVVLDGARGDPLAGSLGEAALINLSAGVPPATSRRVAGALRVGEHNMAAPILGGPQAVLDGPTRYLLAGPERGGGASLEQAVGAASSVSHRRCHARTGHRHHSQDRRQLPPFVRTGRSAEAVATAQGAGVDAERLQEGLLHPAAGGTRYSQPTRRCDGRRNHHEGWFASRLGAKDAQLMGDMAALGRFAATPGRHGGRALPGRGSRRPGRRRHRSRDRASPVTARGTLIAAVTDNGRLP